MKTSFETTTPADCATLWSYYTDVQNWPRWDPAVQAATLTGAFTDGSTGQINVPGQPPLAFELANVVTGARFTVTATLPTVGRLAFDHNLTPTGNGTTICHSIALVPATGLPTALASELLAKFFAPVPQAVMTLAEQADA